MTTMTTTMTTTSTTATTAAAATSVPATRLQRYDLAGGCNGIDEEFSLPSCTSTDLFHSSEFERFARKVRREYCARRYGAAAAEAGGDRGGGGGGGGLEVPLPFAESDRAVARRVWGARAEVRDLWMHAGRRRRADWTMGERLGWAMLQVRARLPVVRTAAAGLVRLPLASLATREREGEWLLALLEYKIHLWQRVH